jgi:hypothetical protein
MKRVLVRFDRCTVRDRYAAVKGRVQFLACVKI